MARTKNGGPSRRYPGYVRVHSIEYRRASIELIREDAAPLVEALGLAESVNDLEQRVSVPERESVAGKVTRRILDRCGVRNPLNVSAQQFNREAERFYRDELRQEQLREGLSALRAAWRSAAFQETSLQRSIGLIGIGLSGVDSFLKRISANLLYEQLSSDDITKLVALTVLTVDRLATVADAERATMKRRVALDARLLSHRDFEHVRSTRPAEYALT